MPDDRCSAGLLVIFVLACLGGAALGIWMQIEFIRWAASC